MTGGTASVPDAEAFAEIERLREKIARLEERVRQLDDLAHQDALLPVPNRRGFLRELDSAIARVSRYGETAALLFVDIDGLKRINDSLGHLAGDAALVHVATALTDAVRKSDCVARLGGDEFGILLVHAGEEIALDTAKRLTAVVEQAQAVYDGQRLPLSIAIGVAVIDKDDTPDRVIARADRAMYARKAAA
ncbi:GGDEF domain-containing protein [Sphingomonas sabuli]|uniref:GGDEF domain-containing protein n=1 Tax=Sphingomonas sabuli TaxID=2764186 RepID=A0A7G9L087_9SPHN|nr:GGDEF domain-containing protein [Sphingomonas sabuli]QNM82036.1 GGDEF domain-containing protein [Sphingomonas sabuli]